jgi:hypothetical protein
MVLDTDHMVTVTIRRRILQRLWRLRIRGDYMVVALVITEGGYGDVDIEIDSDY